MWNYTNAVHEHFLHPHNAGPMEDANAIGEVGSLACGDALKLYLKINDDGIIEKASFETFGCASAIASSSVLTDMVKGMKAEDALKLTNKEIAEALGGLPKERCTAPSWARKPWRPPSASGRARRPCPTPMRKAAWSASASV